MEDNGAGIENNKLETINHCLNSNYVLEICNNLNRNFGCGLGLAISHCLALLLGPFDTKGLVINSEQYKGTKVSFYIEGFFEDETLSVIEENIKENTKPSSNFQNSAVLFQKKKSSLKGNPNDHFEKLNPKISAISRASKTNLKSINKETLLCEKSSHELLRNFEMAHNSDDCFGSDNLSKIVLSIFGSISMPRYLRSRRSAATIVLPLPAKGSITT